MARKRIIASNTGNGIQTIHQLDGLGELVWGDELFLEDGTRVGEVQRVGPFTVPALDEPIPPGGHTMTPCKVFGNK